MRKPPRTRSLAAFLDAPIVLACRDNMGFSMRFPGFFLAFILTIVGFGPMSAQTLAADGEPIATEIQVTHPNGVILQIDAIQAGKSETVISVQVINGYKNTVSLMTRSKDSYILSDDGTRLFLSPPEDNTQFKLPGKTKLEGELVFLGRLPETQGVTLVLNDQNGNVRENSISPRFEIAIALPEGTFSNQSKKN